MDTSSSFPQNPGNQIPSEGNNSPLSWVVGIIGAVIFVGVIILWVVMRQGPGTSPPPDGTSGTVEDVVVDSLKEVTPSASISAIGQDISDTNLDSLDLELEVVENATK